MKLLFPLALAIAVGIVLGALLPRSSPAGQMSCALSTIRLAPFVVRTEDGTVWPLRDRDDDPIFVQIEVCEEWRLR